MADTIVRPVRAVKQTFRGVSAVLPSGAGAGALVDYRSFGLPDSGERRGYAVPGLGMTFLCGFVITTCALSDDVILSGAAALERPYAPRAGGARRTCSRGARLVGDVLRTYLAGEPRTGRDEH